MSRKLDFTVMDTPPEETNAERWASRAPNPTVQMSIRMKVQTYDQFRTLCRHERRTNGEMLKELMKAYVLQQGGNQE